MIISYAFARRCRYTSLLPVRLMALAAGRSVVGISSAAIIVRRTIGVVVVVAPVLVRVVVPTAASSVVTAAVMISLAIRATASIGIISR